MHGRDAMRRYIGEWFEMFDDFDATGEEFIDAGGDHAVVVVRISGRAKRSGVPTDMSFAVLYTIRDGKIARGREYATREEALQAAGLD